MGKRAAEKQLTKDDVEAGLEAADAGAGVGPDGTFQKASREVMLKRRIVKVRRSGAKPATETTSPAANPFAATLGASKAPEKTTAPNSFAKLPPAESAPVATTPPKSTTPTKEPASEDEPPAPSADVPKADDDDKSAEVPVEKEVAKENGQEKKSAVEKKEEEKDKKEEKGGTPPSADKETKPEEKPSTVDAAVTSKSEKPASEKPKESNAKETSEKPTENTDGAKDTASTPAKTDAKKEEPSPAVFKFSKPFVFGGAATTSVKTFADAANASKDSASNDASNGGGGNLAGGFTFSKEAAASLSAAMKKSAENNSTSFAGVSKLTTPSKQSFQETKVESGEEGETTVHKVRAKVFGLDGGAWRERGVGCLKLNIEDKAKTARLLLRNEATLRLALNAPLYKDIKLDRAGERGLRLKDVSSGTVFLVRVGSKDDAQKLVDVVEEEAKKLA